MKGMKLKRLLALTMIFCLSFAVIGCKKQNETDDDGTTPTPTQAATDNNNSDDVEKNDDGNTGDVTETADTYTYNYAMGSTPLTWNPHNWETNGDNELSIYIETPFVDTTIADDGVNFEWLYEAANAITDITADFADKDKWGLTGETEGYVYQIDLNPDVKWSDGTVINADSYIYSMKSLLDPAMKNYRANTYYSGTTAVRNAMGYYMNDKVGEPTYGDAVDAEDADTYYMNTDEACYFFGNTMAAYYAGGYDTAFFDEDGNDLYAKYTGQGYVEVTDEVKADLLTIALNFGDENPEAWIEFCFVVTGAIELTPWEEVGLLKGGEYQLIYITETPVTMFYFLTNMTSTWLVHEGLYEAGKETREGLVATNYNTSLDTTLSYGPYKLVSFEKDKQMVLTKNENWYGWTDGKHDGWYQTTDVKIDIISEHNTELQLFNQGKLDGVDLAADDMSIYRMSDNLRKTDQTYTFRYIFATDLDALKALESEANDGANKQVLSYTDFRKALSLSIDRAKFCAEATSAYKPAYYLFNSLYYYDIENNTNSIYRNTDEAKLAVLRLYDISYGSGTPYADIDEAYDAVTGFNVEAAKKLFQSVYEQAIADGRYTDGQAININCMASAASALTPDDIRQQDLLNEFTAEATKGTGFEGKITFTFNCGAEKRYDDVAGGRIEMIRGAWGGAAFYPFSSIRMYTEPDYMGGLNKIHESCGWNPSTETLEITYDFDNDGTPETLTDTFQNWAKSINPGGTYVNDPTICMVVMSYLETGVLNTYQCIPWAAETRSDLYSKQVEYATLNYNIMYGYGGLRLMTYNYTDAQWDEYVASQGGIINYE